MRERAAALGPQLVAEVADEAAGKANGELLGARPKLGQFALEPVEQRPPCGILTARRGPRVSLPAATSWLTSADERTSRRTHVGEASERGRRGG